MDSWDIQQVNNQIYTFGMIVRGLIESMAMMSENMQRQQLGQSMAYNDADFIKVADDNMIHHNGILTNLYSR
jgi:hypothetical protein